MLEQRPGPTAVIGDDDAPELVRRLSETGDVVRFRSVTDLMRSESLPVISVLVVLTRAYPGGVPLAVLAWINLRYPRIQKVAVVEGALPLPVARFLTSCGVELIWARPTGSVEQIASVVGRMNGDSGWIAPWIDPLTIARAELENEHGRA